MSTDLETVLRQALAAAVAERDTKTVELVALQERVTNLNKTISGLEGLVGDVGGGDTGRAAATGNAAMTSGSSFGGPGPQRGGGMTSGTTLGGGAPRAVRRRQPGGSTLRLLSLLSETNKPMSLRDITEQFHVRNWVLDAWSHPEAAISAAVRRAVKNAEIVQLPNGLYTSASGAAGNHTGSQTTLTEAGAS